MIPQLIMGPANSGKTKRLIELCKELPNSIICVHSKKEARRVANMCLEMNVGDVVPVPITYSHLMFHKLHDGIYRYVFLDDADMFIKYILTRCGAELAGMSLTKS